ncbi:SMI1/KNR4 family protein [Rossellomorea sp. BNER]|uniref:SMI1/KNR4 family protein n=1 Tax=Rossellomorea sp. BNER TaxID=2962031 RepID=UPI003AF2EC19|nr:SMI1/KNR4 family protein [Rossellomorea sp. BNER]
MEQFKKKLEEIIDFDIKEKEVTWGNDSIKKLEEKYKLKLPQDYVFYLQHFGNDYIREDYRFISTIELPQKIKQTQFEIDSIYGLDNDENKLENKIKFYKDILPADLLPIADLPGGDLVCLGKRDDKQNKIYIWFHEMSGENVYLVAESFENFIKNFKRGKAEKNTLDNVKMKLSGKLNDFLSNASKK